MVELIAKNWLGIAVVILIIIYATGGFDTYWERHKTVYDPKLNRSRCIDKDTGEIMDIDPPCVVLTLDGQKAIKKRQEKCEKNGGNPEDCKKEAWDWIFSKIPGQKK